MRIGIMLRHFGARGGIGVYTDNITRALLTVDSRNEYLLIYRSPDHLGHFAGFPNAREMAVAAPHTLWWDQVAVPRVVREKHLDLVYNPKLSIPLFAGCKTVLVMHGGAQFAIPQAYLWHDRLYFTLANRLYCQRANAVITMTQTGARDIVRYMGADPKKVHAIPESYNESCWMPDREQALEVKRKYRLPDHYLLFVGGISPLKNFGNILRAYALLHQRFPHKLVVVGFRRWKYNQDLALLDELGLHDDVIFTDFVPDEDIPSIYNLADAFVFPSLYEGFGMPALEAMACGCPVIVSRTGCSPEVVGDAALLVNPYQPDDIASAITTLLTDTARRDLLIRKGFDRARQFSWRKCAAETIAVFESVVNQPSTIQAAGGMPKRIH